MGYNKTELINWIREFDLLKASKVEIKEDVNFHGIETLSFDIENAIDLGIVIIYCDGHLFFDFLSKEDPLMESKNWSKDFKNNNKIKMKISGALIKYWKI